MRLATVRTGTGTTAAVVDEQGRHHALPAEGVDALLGRPDWLSIARRALDGPALEGDIVYAPVVLAPRKVISCGLNFADHIAEMGRPRPEYPTLFAKYADTLIGAGDEIRVPPAAQGCVDWEAELAVVVGGTLVRADEEAAGRAIAGYTVANDISMRDWQHRTTQWFQGKAWDASTPVGPVLVTPDEVDPVAGLGVRCVVDGRPRQSGNTGQLVFGAAALLSYISHFTTLRPGDLVLTGTPGGVGSAAQPPDYCRDGSTVVTEIDGIGRLANTVRFVAV